MNAYTYRAVHLKTGQVKKGSMSATNENELSNILKESDLQIIEVKEQRITPYNHSITLFNRSYYTELSSLCLHMADMLGAGVPLEVAFHLSIESLKDSSFKTALIKILKSINEGKSLSLAFSEHPHFFNQIFLSIIYAGETSGDLTKTFKRLHSHIRWQSDLAKHIKKCTRYPLFLLALTIAVMTFMLGAVLPQLLDFLHGLDQKLPLITRMLIGSAELFIKFWWVIPALSFGFLIVFYILRKFSASTAILADRIILSLPILGALLKQLELAQLFTNLSLLIKAGIPVPAAIQKAKLATKNQSLQHDIGYVYDSVISGTPLSKACSTLIPPFATQMLIIGEKSARMPQTLNRIASTLEEQSQEAIHNTIGMLEPFLTILVGGLMAWIVLAVLGPIYSSITVII